MDWIYLTFFPIAVAIALSSYVLAQNPRGRSHRIFALYALTQAIGSHATLAMTTTDAPVMAQVATIAGSKRSIGTLFQHGRIEQCKGR